MAAKRTASHAAPAGLDVTGDDLFQAQAWAIEVLNWYAAISIFGVAIHEFHEPGRTQRPDWLRTDDLPGMIASRWQDVRKFPDALYEKQHHCFRPDVQKAIERGNFGRRDGMPIIAFGEQLATAHHAATRALGVGVAVLYGFTAIWEERNPGKETPEGNFIGFFPNELLIEENRTALLKVVVDIPRFNGRELVASIRTESHCAAKWLDAQETKPAKITTAALMLEMLQKSPETRSWTCREWADHLGVDASTVAKSKTWKTLNTLKGAEQSEVIERSRE